MVSSISFFSWFYVEVKAFEFLVEEGRFVLHIVKRNKGVSRAVFMCQVSVEWLLDTVEALVQGEGLKELHKSSTVGSTTFLA